MLDSMIRVLLLTMKKYSCHLCGKPFRFSTQHLRHIKEGCVTSMMLILPIKQAHLIGAFRCLDGPWIMVFGKMVPVAEAALIVYLVVGPQCMELHGYGGVPQDNCLDVDTA